MLLNQFKTKKNLRGNYKKQTKALEVNTVSKRTFEVNTEPNISKLNDPEVNSKTKYELMRWIQYQILLRWIQNRIRTYEVNSGPITKI